MEGIAERHVDMDLLIFGRKTVKPMKKDTARRWKYGGKSQTQNFGTAPTTDRVLQMLSH